MERKWALLPKEILETKILPALPVVSLCRFRAVCKKWNTLITHPDFATKHALAAPPQECLLITLQVDLPVNSWLPGGWDVLEVANGKVFTVNTDFLASSLQLEDLGGEPENIWNHQRRVLAADGGLFFLEYQMEARPEVKQVLLVCNPALRAVKLLPPLPGWVKVMKTNESVVMSTDRVSKEYRIMVLHQELGDYRTNSVDIYESSLGRWRTVELAPGEAASDGWYCESKFVKLDMLYRIYRQGGEDNPHLFAFDCRTGGAAEPSFTLSVSGETDHLDTVELVASGDRLFWVSMRGDRPYFSRKEVGSSESRKRIKKNGFRSIEIFEVDLASQECTRVSVMPRKVVKWLYCCDRKDWDFVSGVINRSFLKPVVSTGCTSSVVISSCVGRSAGYNLVDRCWHQYSDNRLLQARDRDNPRRWMKFLFSSSGCLSLCPP